MTRLDQALVERGLCESREQRQTRHPRRTGPRQRPARPQTQRLRQTRGRTHPGAPAKNSSAAAATSWNTRCNHFQLDVTGLTALDLGASTGGFTDCLLQHGAAKVFAVDVGQGQLAWKLRQRPARRRHGKNQRAASDRRRNFPSRSRPPTWPSIDCSFISLRKILPAAIALLKPDGKIVALIKPQFEAGKAEADKGRGVITDPPSMSACWRNCGNLSPRSLACAGAAWWNLRCSARPATKNFWR